MLKNSRLKFSCCDFPIGDSNENLILLAIENNVTDLVKLKDFLIKSVGKFKTHFEFLSLVKSELDLDGKVENCTKNCDENRVELQKLFIKSHHLKMRSQINFGTLIRQMSDKLGITFSNAKMTYWTSTKDCSRIGLIENRIHEILVIVSRSIGLKGSLYDIPNVFKRSGFETEERKRNYPMYSVCNSGIEMGSFFQICSKIWDTFLKCDKDKDLEEVCIINRVTR